MRQKRCATASIPQSRRLKTNMRHKRCATASIPQSRGLKINETKRRNTTKQTKCTERWQKLTK